MVLALKAGEISRFKSEFRDNVDCLLLEDIHFFQGKQKMQDEILETLKSLQLRGSKVVMTSSFLPRELDKVDPQLVSRFSSVCWHLFPLLILRPERESLKAKPYDWEPRFRIPFPNFWRTVLPQT